MLLRGAYSQNIPELLGIHGIAVAILFYTILLVTLIVMCARNGEILLPIVKDIRVPLSAIAFSIVLIIAGGFLTPPLSAFQLYARASMYLFVGHCKDSDHDLGEALKLDSDTHLKQLILQRLWQVKQICGRSLS
jgi:hypothetical protein